MECSPWEDIAAFWNGISPLSEESYQNIKAHLAANCPRCSQVIDSLNELDKFLVVVSYDIAEANHPHHFFSWLVRNNFLLFKNGAGKGDRTPASTLGRLRTATIRYPHFSRA